MTSEIEHLLPDSVPVPGYRLIAKLGEGQFGQVWRSSGPGGHEVALKFLKMDDAGGAREFKAVQRIKSIHHPNLVALFASWIRTTDGRLIDESTIGAASEGTSSKTPGSAELEQSETFVFDETRPDASLEGADEEVADGSLFATDDATPTPVASLVKSLPPGCELIVAMELGDKTLEDRLDECPEGGIPREELLDYMEEAAKGVDHLNREKLIHGDIKPTNLLLVGGAVKVCDFGLARYFDDERMTIAAMGTPRYAAPELLKGHPAATSDQYCLAITYRDLRTGSLEGPPSLLDLPASEREVLEKATSPDPATRYSTCRDMVKELRTGPPKRKLLPAAALLLTVIVIAVVIGVKFFPPGGPGIPPSAWKQLFDEAIQDKNWKTADDLLKTPPLTLGNTELDDARVHISDEWKKTFDNCIADGDLDSAREMAESFSSVIGEDTRSTCTLALQEAWYSAFDSLLEENSFGQAEKLLDDPVAGIDGQKRGELGSQLRDKWQTSYEQSVDLKNVKEAEKILAEAPRTVGRDTLDALSEELCEKWRGWMNAALVKRNVEECNELLDDSPTGLGYEEILKFHQRKEEMKGPTFAELTASIRTTLRSSGPSGAREILNSAESEHADHAEYEIWGNIISLHDQSTSQQERIKALGSVKSWLPTSSQQFETLLASDFWGAWAKSSEDLVRAPESPWEVIDAAIAVAEHLRECAPSDEPPDASKRRRALCERMVELRLRSGIAPDEKETGAYLRLESACKKFAIEDGLAGLWLIEQELKRDPANEDLRGTLGRIEVDDERWTDYYHFVKAYAWKTRGEGDWAKACGELQLVFSGTAPALPKPVPAWLKQAAGLSVDAADRLYDGIGVDNELNEVADGLSSRPFGVASDLIYALLSRVEKDYKDVLSPSHEPQLRKYLALSAASGDRPDATEVRRLTADLDMTGDIVLSSWTFRCMCRLEPPIDASDEKLLLASGHSLFKALSKVELVGTLTKQNCRSLEDDLIQPLLKLAKNPATGWSDKRILLLEDMGDFVWQHRHSGWQNGAPIGGIRLCESLYLSPTGKELDSEGNVSLKAQLASCHLKAARTIMARPTWAAKEVRPHVEKATEFDQSLESYHLTHYVNAKLSHQSSMEDPSRNVEHIRAALQFAEEAVRRVPDDSPERALYKVTLSGANMQWAHYERDRTFAKQKEQLREAVELATEAVDEADHRYIRNARLMLGQTCEDLAWLAAESPKQNYARAIGAFREIHGEFNRDPQAALGEARCYYRMVTQSRLRPPFFDELDDGTIEKLDPGTLHMNQKEFMRKCVEILDGVESSDRFQVEACYYAAKARQYLDKIAYSRTGKAEAAGGDDGCLSRFTEAWERAKDLNLSNRNVYFFGLMNYQLSKAGQLDKGSQLDEGDQEQERLRKVEEIIEKGTLIVEDSDFLPQWKTDWQVFCRRAREIEGEESGLAVIEVCDDILANATNLGLSARMTILALRANSRDMINEFSSARIDYLELAELAYDAPSSATYRARAAASLASEVRNDVKMDTRTKITELMRCRDEVESAAKLAENEPQPQRFKGEIAFLLALLHDSQQDHNQACKYASEALTAAELYNEILQTDPTSSDKDRDSATERRAATKEGHDQVFQAAGDSLSDKTDQDFESEDLGELLTTVFTWLEERGDARTHAQNTMHNRLKPRYGALSR